MLRIVFSLIVGALLLRVVIYYQDIIKVAWKQWRIQQSIGM
ncbi:hypothetical protein CU035_2624 [Enterococcus faecium]|nr:hypothetical protein [Enterococcus faecium]MBK4794420.1 hypothetical protein [Enterococcus faecium]MBK4797092.1 hypothetical protein [Enterococcus faecium]MBK4818490.1 hypothetical protein [Enterococcus faecium]